MTAEVHAKHMTVIKLPIIRKKFPIVIEPQDYNTVSTKSCPQTWDQFNPLYNLPSHYSEPHFKINLLLSGVCQKVDYHEIFNQKF